jgi:hypothetical protein
MSAIKGDYTTHKHIPSRKVYQLIIEIPEEEFPNACSILGYPSTSESTSVGIALLNKEKIEKPKRDNLLQAAAMICKEKQFHEYLGVDDEHEARRILCEGCGIEQRRDLKDNEEARRKFKVLLGEYSEYKRFGR